MPPDWEFEDYERGIKTADAVDEIAKYFGLFFDLPMERNDLEECSREYTMLEDKLHEVLASNNRQDTTDLLIDLLPVYRACTHGSMYIDRDAEYKDILIRMREASYSDGTDEVGKDIMDHFTKFGKSKIDDAIADYRNAVQGAVVARKKYIEIIHKFEAEGKFKGIFEKGLNKEIIDETKRLASLNDKYKRLSGELDKYLGEYTAEAQSMRTKLRKQMEKIEDPIRFKVKREKEALWEKRAREIIREDKELAQVVDDVEKKEEAFYDAIKNTLLDASGISEEQAINWVNEYVTLDKKLEKKLWDIYPPYPPEQLKADLAELYRLAGGNLGRIEFVNGGKRAFARGNSIIGIDVDFSKRALFHECGHLMEEWDSAFNVSCKAFVKARAEGEPRSLKELTGCNYGPDEVAYPDHFIDPYVGKSYPMGAATEVYSMGIEMFTNSQRLAELAETDPEHFEMIMGFCMRKNPALAIMAERDLASVKTTKNAEKERLRKLAAWRRELDKVAGQDLQEKLERSGGFYSYYISRRKGYCLYKKIIHNNGEEWFHTISRGGKVDLRNKAYFLIANDMDLLPQHYDARNEIEMDRFTDTLIMGAPAWFDVNVGLPRLPE